MVVKAKVGRRRYISFRVPEPAPDRGKLADELRRAGYELIVYELGVGVARVPHVRVDAVRDELAKMGLEPITTSGTMRAARERAGLPPAKRRR